jgi:hypothetical protein
MIRRVLVSLAVAAALGSPVTAGVALVAGYSGPATVLAADDGDSNTHWGEDPF